MGWKPRDELAVDTFAEWRPFLLAAREARLQEVPWTLDPLDFRLIGHVGRAKGGPLWTYVHVRTGGDLSVDEDGQPHHVRLDRAMRIRTKRISMSAAVGRTGVPNEEMHREPSHRAEHEGWEECDRCQAWLDAEDSADWSQRTSRRMAPPAPVVGERHLRLVQ